MKTPSTTELIEYHNAMRYLGIFVAALFAFAATSVCAQDVPERAIMVIIDGVHTEAPDRLDMPNFSQLAEQGTLIEKTTAIMPYHPTHGEYATVHTSSYPNPVMMTGTVFLKPNQSMIQDHFENGAFIANTLAYQSISRGYEYVVQKSESDAFAVDQAVRILETEPVDFMRVHLQNAGSAGSRSLSADRDQPFYHNIWHEEAPYVQAIEEADRQLGRFVSALKDMGKWEETLLVVTSDHGQTKTGWHPVMPEESWFVPTIFHGPGVNQGQTVEWADQTDLVPTIASLMQVDPPNEDGGAGDVILGATTSESSNYESSSDILDLNRVIKRYMSAEAEMIAKSDEHPYLNSLVMRLERDFYGLDRILDWNEMGSIRSLIEHNRTVVREMRNALTEVSETE